MFFFNPPLFNMNETKKCTKCGEIKPLNEFGNHKNNKDGKMNSCKICYKNYMKQYNEEHKEERAEYMKEYDKTEGRILYHQQHFQKT